MVDWIKIVNFLNFMLTWEKCALIHKKNIFLLKWNKKNISFTYLKSKSDFYPQRPIQFLLMTNFPKYIYFHPLERNRFFFLTSSSIRYVLNLCTVIYHKYNILVYFIFNKLLFFRWKVSFQIIKLSFRILVGKYKSCICTESGLDLFFGI